MDILGYCPDCNEPICADCGLHAARARRRARPAPSRSVKATGYRFGGLRRIPLSSVTDRVAALENFYVLNPSGPIEQLVLVASVDAGPEGGAQLAPCVDASATDMPRCGC